MNDKLGAVTIIEQYIVCALRDHGELYGVPLRHHVSLTVGRDVSIGELYEACDRLEKAGIIVSREGEATAERGWRNKRYWRLTTADAHVAGAAAADRGHQGD